MPLLKPAKMISKRFKKPKLANPAISPPADLSKTPWPAPPSCRKWRIRVVCADPDATDDSSADEAEPSPSPSTARKRLIHEFCVPLPSPSPPTTPQRGRMRSPSHRPTRSLRRDFGVTKAEMSTFLDAVSDAAAASSCSPLLQTSSSVESVDTEEEFTRFLQEFLPEQDDESLWEYSAGLSGTHQESISIAEMLDLELDSEAVSWINSMQRIPEPS